MSSFAVESLGAAGMTGLPVADASTSLATDRIAGGAGRTDAATGPTGPAGPGFGDLLVRSIDSLEGLTDKAADLSVRAATGDLTNIHDYTIAASEAKVATQLTVAVRNKAVEAFTEIMRMSV